MSMKKLGAVLFLLLAMAIGVLATRPAVAPDLRMTTIKGVPIGLKSLRGKPVMVTFWATDCPSCIKEIPDLLALYQDYHPKGFELIAVSMAYDPPSHVVAMSEAKHLTYPVVMDLDSSYAAAFGHVEFTPSTFLLNPDGRIIARYVGLFDIEEIKKLIGPFLKG